MQIRKITAKLIREFKEHLINEEKADSTLEKYVHDVSALMRRCSGREVSKEMLIEYKRELLQDYKPSSVNAVISSLNSFFSYIGWYDLRIKAVKIQREIFARQERELKREEYERLVEAAKGNERLYYLIQTICATAIRVSEDI